MKDFLFGFTMTLVILTIGYSKGVWDTLNNDEPQLHVVAENTGTCRKCGYTTQVVIKETK